MNDAEYLTQIPDHVPDGRCLVHNHVRPTRHLGSHGFRAWLQEPAANLVECDCGWASELGRHFRVSKG